MHMFAEALEYIFNFLQLYIEQRFFLYWRRGHHILSDMYLSIKTMHKSRLYTAIIIEPKIIPTIFNNLIFVNFRYILVYCTLCAQNSLVNMKLYIFKDIFLTSPLSF